MRFRSSLGTSNIHILAYIENLKIKCPDTFWDRHIHDGKYCNGKHSISDIAKVLVKSEALRIPGSNILRPFPMKESF